MVSSQHLPHSSDMLSLSTETNLFQIVQREHSKSCFAAMLLTNMFNLQKRVILVLVKYLFLFFFLIQPLFTEVSPTEITDLFYKVDLTKDVTNADLTTAN